MLKNNIEKRIFFREFGFPSKKTYQMAIPISNINELMGKIRQIGSFTNILFDFYGINGIGDRKKSYLRSGVVLWKDSFAITGINKFGQRVNIGFISKSF